MDPTTLSHLSRLCSHCGVSISRMSNNTITFTALGAAQNPPIGAPCLHYLELRQEGYDQSTALAMGGDWVLALQLGSLLPNAKPLEGNYLEYVYQL